MSIKKKVTIIAILAIGIIFVSITGTYAKYVSNSMWKYYLKSQNFYFESDEVSIDGKNHSDTLWNGEAITFNLNNYVNDELITDIDIEYDVTCEVEETLADKVKCQVQEQDSYHGTLSNYQKCVNTTDDGVDVSGFKKSECEMAGYTYEANKTTKQLSFNLVKLDENYEITKVNVKLNVTSTTPYKKNMYANYTLNRYTEETASVEKMYTNHGDYSRLVISNYYNEKKCVNVKWDSNTKIMDLENSNYEVISEDSEYVDGIKIEVEPKSNISYIFYDKTSVVDDFTIETTDCN